MPHDGGPVRIGILGASSFAPTTIINPAKENAEVVVAAAASRDQPSADEFAAKYGISKAYGSYEALIDDPDLDAIYVLVPTSMHGRWTKAALAAGKHVLCEKPFTANAAEAREVAELAAKSDRVVMEAIQFRHHPLTRRVEEVIASGELGTLQRVDVSLCVLLPTFKANCYNFALGGGAMMDAGSYVANMARTFGGSTPEVVSAQAKLQKPHVDRAMSAELRYAGGHTGRLRCALWSANLFWATASVVGDAGKLRVLSPAAPHLYPRLSIRSANGRRVERFSRRATYAYQLDTFAAAVLRGEPVRTTPEDAVENMSVIDAVYRAAGLPIREAS
ncbi:Gfo/Idh/MocA family protein [Mycolicibacterium holsaticum]|uniref:Gfo/Idh/MocA family protein n=1 Tax=Mycolicibacterium holsaticum TaxID=152142 RepID=UPI001C7D0337|nr:Gfo/Idh/MocA family oxidoreductase [Mycolicibacterium holsaticum]MDA4110869.1 oxidoreductase [Mycolicibacterium holsaticum DSM 44478 = JCM 12374]QZA12186.1 Gfo/Idh/MocA family oxidoreductase [Mycolicibacterium holsaticum DSM 44478 = JCM 12374]UNC10328.1 Gfo/Idh/MocA family oxidoreductase [Mycolicibacterium holsaticum DSM 44478 = JCM 12374]